MVHVVMLSGGSGTRLWPLSNKSRSKQFLKVLRDGNGKRVSMVQRVFGQIAKVDVNLDITVATCSSQENSIRSQVKGDYALVLEPERRDTSPAIMLACAHLAMHQDTKPDDTVVVMPIDTYADQGYYNRISLLDEAVQSGRADLVLLGVEPTYPSAKYGYIVPASHEGSSWPVARFMEKPSEEIAKDLIGQGALWNCGVFAFKLGYLSSVTRSLVDAANFDELCSRYSELPKISFDYEVVEKADSVAVVPYSGTWKDLGTWNTLTDEMAEAYSGRVVVDEETCSNIHVINETGFPLVVAGLKDSVVVATPDGVLVSDKEASANIKAQVARAAESRPMYEKRRWGEYRVIDSSVFPDGSKALTKELVVVEGRQLSYQRHMRRSEVWTVVSGQGEVVLDGEAHMLGPGSVVNVERKALHAMRALGSDLHVIEVQLGEVLVEDDIERFGDFWK
ncbi:sugar phosphate nucleotidyltransferase [Eggerthella sinensis]|uniref:sugar phosphate nucleotidyltransferase n=1 Tax=Eggerthella sinensis TaxID=242230 RepID=UPI001D06E05C|nr:sugar phosphate nucleotidyltransferase [Eggerthella sinensis]MCB7039343.1 cupin domain-containing protein [Eggerthella sinensis]